ncbi:MAG: ABC transporter ATP-binding protein [Myxococcales bacterium]|nr:ABC transporter ATP-binding protein [Myxococcales bacterium]
MNPSPTPIIEVRDLHLAFGPQRVFEGLNLEVMPGEVLTLIGGSGCGKSVLLKTILRLLTWQSGTVVVDGEDISDYREDQMLSVRRKVGMVFQNGALFDSLTVFENLAYPLRERGCDDDAVLAARASEVLEMVGLPGIEHKMPAQLSGGMRKRVALARAVAEAPKVLLYDEPTTGLDPINVRRISELILDLNRRLQITSLCVTHDLPSAYMISDRMAMVAERRIIEVAKTDELRHSDNPVVRDFLTAMDSATARASGIPPLPAPEPRRP